MKQSLLITLMLALAFCLNAQDFNPLAIEKQYPDDKRAATVYDTFVEKQLDEETTALRTTWIANRPKDNWFVSLFGGAGILMSEETRYMPFWDNQVAPTAGFAIGRWFTPVWGLRVSGSAANLNGYAIWNERNVEPDGTVSNVGWGFGDWYIGKKYPAPGVMATNTYVHAYDRAAGSELIYNRFLQNATPLKTPEGDGYTFDVKYAGLSFDYMVNLKSLFLPYNHKGFFNPVLYGGLGYTYTLGNKGKEITDVHCAMLKGGLQLNFRLGDRWQLFVDGQALIVPENFDRRVGDGFTQDFVANVTAGLTYRINFRHFIKAPVFDPREITAILDEVEELRNRPIPVCPPMIVCPPPVEPEPFMLTPVFFTLDSYVVRDNQLISIAKAAQYLMENSNAKIKIAAYADKNTGNPKYNMKLSANRANAVADVLVQKFGIEKDRLIVEYYGDTVQPFEENDWNRVAIFVIP